MIRRPRHLGIRILPEDSAVALCVIEVLPGEDLANIICPMMAFSLPEALGGFVYTGPAAFMEYSPTLLFVPFNIAATFSSDNYGTMGVPASTEDWDRLYRRLVFEFGVDGSEYYGANPDDVAVYDVNTSLWLRRAPSTPLRTDAQGSTPSESAAADPQASQTGDLTTGRFTDEPLLQTGVMGPLGVIRLDGAERWLIPSSLTSSVRGFAQTILSAIPWVGEGVQAGINDLTFTDVVTLSGQGPLYAAAGGYVILGAHRYKANIVTDGFAASNVVLPDSNVTQEHINAMRRRFHAIAYGADRERLQRLISFDASDLGNFARALLYGGDLMLETLLDATISSLFGQNADLFPSSITSLAGSSFLRPNDIVLGAKAGPSILSIYNQQIV